MPVGNDCWTYGRVYFGTRWLAGGWAGDAAWGGYGNLRGGIPHRVAGCACRCGLGVLARIDGDGESGAFVSRTPKAGFARGGRSGSVGDQGAGWRRACGFVAVFIVSPY